MLKLLFPLVLCLSVSAPAATQLTVRPGESLQAVQLRARQAAKPVVVTLADGRYELARPLKFGPADSHVTWRAAAGAHPVLTGARRITGWRLVGSNVWEAAVADGWRFRRLFVNGAEKERARYPNTGYFVVKRENIVPDPSRPDRPNEPSQKVDRLFLDPAETLKGTDDLDEGEFVLNAAWRDSHHPVVSYDPATRLMILGTPLKYGQFWDWGRGYPFHFENLPAIMDVPGEWCLITKRNAVRYLAADGEDPNAEEIVAPCLDRLVEIAAEPAKDGRWVEGVNFCGLAFEKANFWLPREDCADMQAADHTGCGILLKGARNCRFEACAFRDFTAYCVDVRDGSRANAFVGCTFSRAGSGGVRIDGGRPADPPFAQTRGTRIERCEIADWGVEFPSACGVIVQNAAENEIVGSSIHDGPYTGVSLGWNWSYSNSVARGNAVVSNHIYNINANHLLSDLGGVYTLGVSPGTVIRGNRIHDVYRRNYNGNGIYMDESSSHILVENNVIWNTQDSCLHIHFGKELTIRNNVFAETRRVGSAWAISRGFAEPHVTMYFTGNIIQRLEGVAYSSFAPKKWDASAPYTFHNNGRARPIQRTENMLTDYNYFVRPDERTAPKFFGGYPLAEWQAGGRDVHSLVGDSPFADPSHGDFTLKADTPARKVFDPTGVPLRPFDFGDSEARQTVAARTAAEKARGAGKRGWIAWEAERNQYFPAQNRTRVEAIAKTLPSKAAAAGTPARFRAEWDALAATAEGRKRIAAAEKTLKSPVEKVTLACYDEYRRTGDRAAYAVHHRVRKAISTLVYGEALEHKGRFLAKLAAYLDGVADEPSWIAPYEGGAGDCKKPLHGVHYIDLSASATAALVATAVAWFREELPPETVAHVLDTLRGRIFETFLKDARRTGEKTPYCNWWMPDRFNWSAVCHNGCVTAILAVEDDARVRAEAIEAAERLMAPCFLSGFLDDGYCEEGMGYWNYGFGNFMKLAGTVRAATDGRVDFCRAFPRAKLVATFGAKYRLDDKSSPPFADGNGRPDAILLSLINQAWPDLYAAEATADPLAGEFWVDGFRSFGRFKTVAPKGAKKEPLPSRDWFDKAGVLIARAAPLSLAVKGGSNGDRHNHDDAGSYVIDVGGAVYAGDPGNENYTARTFSKKRYESPVLNSYAHPVPLVAGARQGGGPAFGAKVLRTDFTPARDTIVYDLAGAYPAKVPLRKLERTVVFDRTARAVTVTDAVEFAAPSAFETPVIAWQKPVAGGDAGHFYLVPSDRTDLLAVSISATGGAWERTDEFIANPGRTQPWRVAIRFREPIAKGSVTIRYALAAPRQLGVLTPPESPAPRINGPSVFGVSTGKPVFYYVPVTGSKPLTVDVKTASGAWPKGLKWNSATRLLEGRIAAKGDYRLVITASNALGRVTRPFTLKVGSGICLTPPLGWNSWNCWGQAVSDEKMRQAADAFVTSGLRDHGWSYIVLDDCWRTRPTEKEAGMKRPDWIGNPAYMYGPARAADGTPVANSHFPDMKALADYIHSKGLKCGLYSVPGTLACCFTFGSWAHEAKDAATWADWGYDLVKYDWCYASREWGKAGNDETHQFKAYRLMGDELAKQDRDIVYNVCNYGKFNVLKWARKAGGHYWRTNDDLKDTWPLLRRSIDANLNVADAAGPGGWNDPDMLVVGPMRSNGFTKSRLTPNEQYAHLTLWAMIASPLFIGCDVTRLDPLARALLTNDEVIEIDQDPLGKTGRPLVHTADFDIWTRPLADGSFALALFNRGPVERTIAADFKRLGLPARASVRDVWVQNDLGTFTGFFSAPIPSHAALLYRLTDIFAD